MSELSAVAERRRGDGFNTRELLRDDREWAACLTCRKKHPLRGNNADQDYADFAFRHQAGRGCVCLRFGPEEMERIVCRAEKLRRRRRRAVREFTHNASVLEAFQASDQSLTITALNSLASSATAGWGSAPIDNSANLYLDYLYAIGFALVNTAPSSDKCFYVFAASALNTTELPATGAASGVLSASAQGALTFPSVSTTANGLDALRPMPYSTTNIATQSGVHGTAWAMNGGIGLYLWYAMVNFSGMTIAASGNSWRYRGVYLTCA